MKNVIVIGGLRFILELLEKCRQVLNTKKEYGYLGKNGAVYLGAQCNIG